MSTETELGFIVPVDADAPNGPLQIGGNATKANELLQKGGVSAHTFVEESSRTSSVFGSFGTPLAVTLPFVKLGQMIDVYAMVPVQKGTSGSAIQLQVAGSGVAPENKLESANVVDIMAFSPTAGAGINSQVFSNAGGVSESEAKSFAALMQSLPSSMPFTWHTIRVDKNRTNLVIEVVAKAATGTIKLYGGVIAAHVRA